MRLGAEMLGGLIGENGSRKDGPGQVVALLPAGVALLGLVIVPEPSVWLVLTVAGLGMGMVLFMTTAGMTLVFGQMNVMNFGHGVFMTLGAFVAALLFYPNLFMSFYEWAWTENRVLYEGVDLLAGALALVSAGYFEKNLLLNVLVVLLVAGLIMLVLAPAAWIFERLFIRPAGRSPLMQIMLTTTGMIFFAELFTGMIGRAVFMRPPQAFRGSWVVGDVSFEKMRILMLIIGLLVWLLLKLLLYRTRWGILIRATVENRELVEICGFRTRRLMMATFMLAAGLAAIGGMVWGMFQTTVALDLGNRLLPLMFMVLMIGGTGSLTGTLLASLMVGLVTNYTGYSLPGLSPFASVLLMMAVVLWRPDGLYPLGRN